MTAARHDLYARIHKGIRAMLGDTLLALGRLDASDDADLADALARLEETLAFCESHMRHEDDFIHPALESRLPGSVAVRFHEHVEHAAAIRRLRELAAALGRSGPAPRAAAAHALYRDFGRFVAESLVHMDREETGDNALLWSAFSDAELAALEAAIVRALPEGLAMQGLRWMMPALAPQERLSLVEGLRHGPPAAVQGALALARMHARPADVAKLEARLAPGAQREPAGTLAS